MRKLIGAFCILVSVFIITYVLYVNSQYKGTTREFSGYTLLNSSWQLYAKKFINNDGRVIDYSQNNITTSEGQSYALLRAVWIDDKPTFDRVWKWTKENMKRPHDNLFGWRWGQRSDKTYGFMPDGGDNSATDADEDITLALIFASYRWGDTSYLDSAKKILPDLWKIDTADAYGKRYVIAGNWAQNDRELVINPSYFAPYAWKIFAQVDTKDNWNSLVDPAYTLLTDAGDVPLDKEKNVGLPPDWLVIDRHTGAFKPPVNMGSFTTNYSFDAMRIPWRVALDASWNNDTQAKAYLNKVCTPLEQHYQNDHKLVNTYLHDGTKGNDEESAAMYATALGCFISTNPTTAQDIYQNKIVKLYANDTNTFRSNITYYDQNWLWFGAAMYNKFLIPFKPTKHNG